MARRIITILHNKNIKKTFTYKELFGCEPDLLKDFIKEKFTEGMSYDNYGKWQIDHIKPISSFDLLNDDEIKQCFHYTNLQPLWKEDNLHKSNKIINDTN